MSNEIKMTMETEEKVSGRAVVNQAITRQRQADADFSKDVVVTDDHGHKIAAMREYVFLNLASAGN